MTLNSDEEKKVFRDSLPDFNFIELVDEYGSDQWLDRACSKGVSCDILLISGHFGGSFFGAHGRLNLTDMERQSCSKSCDGITKKPREVFLMGCNTLAGKRKDRRTPQDYANVLVADGFTRAQAEQIAALRYSPIGNTFASRMRQVFSNPQTRIYGFDSIAPSGRNVEDLLRDYFLRVGDYREHLAKSGSAVPNAALAQALKITSFTEAAPAMAGPVENPVCFLQSKASINKKLAWISALLSDHSKALMYAPNFSAYIRQVDDSFGGGDWPEAEASYLERFVANRAAREQLMSMTMKPVPGILTQQAELLNFARSVGWLDQAGMAAATRRLLGPMLERAPTREEVDSVCSSQLQLDISLSALPPHSWDKKVLELISCLRPNDVDVLNAVAMYLDSAKAEIRSSTLDALAQLPVQDENLQFKILSIALKDPDQSVREAAENSLRHLRRWIVGQKIRRALVKDLAKRSPWTFLWILSAHPVLTEEELMEAAEQIPRLQGWDTFRYVMDAANLPDIMASPKVRKRLLEFARGADEDQKRVALFFIMLSIQYPECQAFLIDFLFQKTSDGETLFEAFKQLGIDQLNPELDGVVVKLLKSQDTEIVKRGRGLFERLGPARQRGVLEQLGADEQRRIFPPSP